MTLPQSIDDGLRDSLRREAASHSVEDLISRVKIAVEAVAVAARANDETTQKSPAGGDCTAIQCLSHLVESNCRHAQQILYVALTGELPPDARFEVPPDCAALLSMHSEATESLFAHVREAAPDGFLDMTWSHASLGELNWREWLLALELHSNQHARELTAMRNA